jgi:hypothetical protein
VPGGVLRGMDAQRVASAVAINEFFNGTSGYSATSF